MLGAQSGYMSDVPAGARWVGSPAQPVRDFMKGVAILRRLVRDAGKPVWEWQPATQNEALTAKLIHIAGQDLKDAYQIRNKQARSQKIKDIYTKVWAALEAETASDQPKPDDNAVDAILFDLQAKIVRGQILSGEPRIDGRDTRTIRPIEIRLGVLPRTHGSALFTRGETQALVTATLGTKQDEQTIDALAGLEKRYGATPATA